MNEVKSFLFDLLFPRRCLGCERTLADLTDRAVCPACLRAVTLKKQFACAFCQAPVVGGRTCPFCARDHQLARLLVAADYDQPLVESMVKALKYRFVRSLANDIAALMVKHLEKVSVKEPLFDFVSPIVVPVPLHWRRYNWRGFNQSALLAEKIAAHFGWPLAANILQRTKNNPPQAEQINRTARAQNVVGIFACNQPAAVASRTVLLIDDIATTASTLEECARALTGAGAKEVTALVFARGK